jgi:thiol-disulfide isomerase/thioredoxin
MPKPVTGTFTVDAATTPGHIDLNTDEIDMKPSGSEVKYPASHLPGIYKLQGNVLTIRFGTGSAPSRPKDFTSHSDGAILLVVQRPEPDFKGYPDKVKLTVLDPNGKPAPHEKVFQFLSQRILTTAATQPTPTYVGWGVSATQPASTYVGCKETAADGTLTLPYDEFSKVGVRDTKRKLIGFATASPALLQKGVAVLQLEPECMLTGTLTCEELSKAGIPLGWTNVYLMCDGIEVADYCCADGRFEFPVPPGDYGLDAYGTNFHSTYVPIHVAQGQTALQAKPIALTATRLQMLIGRPAPELTGVVGWKGKPVKLADLRGKIVLIDFWGYWCGPCVQEMPVLMEIHDKFKDKGVVVLGVHVDVDGDVNTAAKLDEKIARSRKTLWNNRDLPFPVALTTGTETPDGYDGQACAQYGVLAYPTTILIDRRGNVVGDFDATDIKDATDGIKRQIKIDQKDEPSEKLR